MSMGKEILLLHNCAKTSKNVITFIASALKEKEKKKQLTDYEKIFVNTNLITDFYQNI